MKTIRIATRGSQLALAQTNYVAERLKKAAPESDISIVEISTKGDRDTSDFLYQSQSVGFFTTEVENALLGGRADVAVHSLKDLPTTITDGLVIAAVPARENPCDVVIASGKETSMDDLPEGATVGTSSLRRITQLQRMRGDLNCQPLRGNVETRIRKVREGVVDAAVLAAAGVIRLHLGEMISFALEPEKFIPAPGQGALAIQTRADDTELCELLSQLNDNNSRLCTETERQILSGLHGGCSIPLGVYAHIKNDIMHINAILCNLSGTQCIEKTACCPAGQAAQTATLLTKQLLAAGGRQILDEIRIEKRE